MSGFGAGSARSQMVPTGHQPALPVHLFDQYDAATKSGGQYEVAHVDWNCLARRIAFGIR
jgi:hypothetical protein